MRHIVTFCAYLDPASRSNLVRVTFENPGATQNLTFGSSWHTCCSLMNQHSDEIFGRCHAAES